MRPIDADALTEKCGDWYVEEGTEEGFIGTVKSLLDGQPSVHPDPCEDAVSRKAVLSMIDTYMNKSVELHYLPTSDGIKKLISILPFVQPEKHTEERTETHACDLISRQALMKEFSDFVRESNNSDGFAQVPTWNDAVSLVGSMPSIQPDDDKLERCRFEYINACKIVTHPTPDTRKKDIDDAYAVVRALNPIFGEEGF